MFKLFIIIILLTYPLKSQFLSIYDIKKDNYPLMEAKMFFVDENGNQILDISKDEMFLTENGTERNIIDISCPQKDAKAAISSVLTIDRSGSMKGKNIKLAKSAAINWVNNMPLDKSECAITSFNGVNFYDQDFTQDEDLLIQKINNIKAEGGTSYNAGFYEPMAGALEVLITTKHKKIIVFLTDGKSFVDQDIIIKKANELNASVYCVTLNIECPEPLKEISENTGGLWFEEIFTENELIKIYDIILNISQGNGPCDITWQSGYNCSLETQNLKLTHSPTGIHDKNTYNPPKQSIAYLDINPKGIDFGNVAIGNSKEISIKIKAVNSDFFVSDIVPESPEFTVNPKSFDISEGGEQEVKITYYNLTDGNDFSGFDINGDPCDSRFFARGGVIGQDTTFTNLKITHPNGGEAFLLGTDTIVTWEGVLPQEKVNLDYSIDAGQSWIPLVKNVDNFKYRWKDIPPPPSNKCLMKVYIDELDNYDVLHTFTSHGSEVEDLSWHPNSRKVATCSFDNSVRFWDTENGVQNKILQENYGWLESVSWSPDGSKIAFGGGSSEIYIYDVLKDSLLKTLTEHNHWIESLKWSPDGKMLASGSSDNRIIIWDAITYQIVHKINGHNGDVEEVSWNFDGSKLASASEDRTVRIWDVQTGAELNIFDEHTDEIFTVCWDPKGNYIASGSRDNDIIVWDVIKGQMHYQLTDHLGNVQSIDWSQDGRYLASGSFDQTIIIWDAVKGEKILEFLDHDDQVNSVRWSPDGRKLASGCADGSVNIFRLNFDVSAQDESDSLWAIVKHDIQALDIDMGEVFVGSFKDSVVRDFVINNGSVGVEIKDIWISGSDSSQFSMISGFAPVNLSAGASHNCEFSFRPSSVGNKNAIINILTPYDTVRQNITGLGVERFIDVNDGIINFGVVEIEDRKELTEFMLKNNSTETIDVDNISMLGPDKNQFYFVDKPAGLTLPPDSTFYMTVGFNPELIGRTSGQIGFYYNDIGSPAKVELFGAGIANSIYVSSDSALPGEARTINLVMHDTNLEILKQVADTVKGTVRFQKTVIAPENYFSIKKIENDSTYIDFEAVLDTSLILTSFDVKAGLGSVRETTMDVTSFVLYDSLGKRSDYSTNIESGKFKILGICEEGGKRLVNPDNNSFLIGVHPNPAIDKLKIDFKLIEKGHTEIYITNSLGQKVKTIYSGFAHPGNFNKNISADNIGSGMYFLIAKTPTILKTKKIFIKK